MTPRWRPVLIGVLCVAFLLWAALITVVVVAALR